MKTIRFVSTPIEGITTDNRDHTCCGAEVIFSGIVRDNHDGRNVTHINYSCYESMAIVEFERIIAEAEKRWPVHAISMIHRLGAVKVGEISIILRVSSVHRREAFEACQYMMDELKLRLPIWKKEFDTTGKGVWSGCERCATRHHPGRRSESPVWR